MFSVGETVLVCWASSDELYPASIKEVDEDSFLVHYVGWSSKWDEWVHSDLIVPVTDQNRHLVSGHWRNLQPKQAKVRKTAVVKRKRTNSTEKHEEFPHDSVAKPQDYPFSLELPANLESFAVYDWELVNVLGHRHEIPSQRSVESVLEYFKRAGKRAKDKSQRAELVQVLVQLFQSRFEDLVYKCEKPLLITEECNRITQVGPIYLLRLLVNLPHLVPQKTYHLHAQSLTNLVQYLSQNPKIFSSLTFDEYTINH